jgi:hypothetical protein
MSKSPDASQENAKLQPLGSIPLAPIALAPFEIHSFFIVFSSLSEH